MELRKRAKSNTPERYLWPKKGARHLWFRLHVPVRYRSVEPRKLIQRSLGTVDRRQASLLAAELRVELVRDWERKLGTSPAASLATPTEADLQRAATDFGYLRTADMVSKWWTEDKSDEADCHRHFIDRISQKRARYVERRHTTDLGLWRYAANALLEEYGWRPDCPTTVDRFGQMIVEAIIDRLRVEIEERSGNFAAEPGSKVVCSGLKHIDNTAPAGQSIIDLFERYAKQRLTEGRKRADTVTQDRKIIQQFARFVGTTRSAASLTQAEVRDWRDLIAALPPKFATAKAYNGLSLREAADKARSFCVTSMSPTTVNKYLSTVSPFLGWCVRNGYAERNPCEGLFYDLPKGRNSRPPFSADELRVLFSSPLFTGFAADGKEHSSGNLRTRDWRFWIPLLCFFTGARVTEVAQLRIQDVHLDCEFPFLEIRHDEKHGQSTKSARSRLAPLHRKLIRLGFGDFVRKQQSADCVTGRLFPTLIPDARGCMGAQPSRFWRNYIKRIGLKGRADGFGTHSFRHLLADRLRQAGYLNEEIAVVLGHSLKSVTSGYGRLSAGTSERLSKMVGELEFDEINHLLP
jgi:integrase